MIERSSQRTVNRSDDHENGRNTDCLSLSLTVLDRLVAREPRSAWYYCVSFG
jgi:hypothetical protein